MPNKKMRPSAVKKSVAAVMTWSSSMPPIPPDPASGVREGPALGGVSVVRVAFDGDPAALRPLLEARGWSVAGSGTTFRIRRVGAPSQGGPATPSADNATSG